MDKDPFAGMLFIWIALFFYLALLNGVFTTKKSLSRLIEIFEKGTFLNQMALPFVRHMPLGMYRFWGYSGLIFITICTILVLFVRPYYTAYSNITTLVFLLANFTTQFWVLYLIIGLKKYYDQNKLRPGLLLEYSALFLGSIPLSAVKLLVPVSMMFHFVYFLIYISR